jgi:syntaxin 16
VEDVERHLVEIDTKLEALKELHRKRLMVTFDTDEQAQDAAIEAAAAGVTSIFRKAEKSLKQISEQTDFGESSDSEQKLRSNIVRTLASRLQQSSVTFRRAQRDFLGRRTDQKKSAGGGGFDFLGTDDKPKVPTLQNVDLDGGQMTMQQLEVIDDLEGMVAQRDHEINAIVTSIEELSAIFKELAVLVIDQGTILDRIDYNMEQVVEKVADGVVELERAEEYQKSARPRWCIAVLLVLIAIFLTLVILKHSDSGSKRGGNGSDDGDDSTSSSASHHMGMLRGSYY